MWPALFKEEPPIGCDIHDRGIRLAQIRRNGRVHQASRQWTPGTVERSGGDDFLVRVLKQLLREGRFRGERVVACADRSQVWSHSVSFGRMPDDELRGAVHWRLADEKQLASGDFCSDFLRCGKNVADGKTELILLAMGSDKTQLERQAAVFKRAGLEPWAIEPSVTALARCIHACSTGGGSDKPMAFLEINETVSNIVVADAGVPRVWRTGIGINQVDETVATRQNTDRTFAAQAREAVGSNVDEAQWPCEQLTRAAAIEALEAGFIRLARDLSRQVVVALNFYSQTARTAAPNELRIMSSSGVSDALLEHLRNSRDFAVHDGNEPMLTPKGRTLDPALACAAGLAMYEDPVAATVAEVA